MSPEYEKKLEERIHRELAKLPEHRAPENLSRSVLEAIEARKALPWWRKAFPHWPKGMQIAFVVATLAFVVAVGFSAARVWSTDLVASIPNQAASAVEPIRPFWSVIESLGHAAVLIAKALGHPVLITIACAMFLLYATCVGMGFAWYRVAIQQARPGGGASAA